MSIVYRHRRLDTNEVFYVGMGCNTKRAHSKRNRSVYWVNIVKKAGYVVEILCENISQKEAFDLEIMLISEYGRKDLNNGLLCNLTAGGEGRKNVITSLETRLIRSKKGKKELKNMPKRGIIKKETRSQKVIDNKTGIIYDTIIDACIISNITLRHFKRCLYNERPNYTSFELIGEKQKYKCRKK
jgi:hypothetical protein